MTQLYQNICNSYGISQKPCISAGFELFRRSILTPYPNLEARVKSILKRLRCFNAGILIDGAKRISKLAQIEPPNEYDEKQEFLAFSGFYDIPEIFTAQRIAEVVFKLYQSTVPKIIYSTHDCTFNEYIAHDLANLCFQNEHAQRTPQHLRDESKKSAILELRRLAMCIKDMLIDIENAGIIPEEFMKQIPEDIRSVVEKRYFSADEINEFENFACKLWDRMKLDIPTTSKSSFKHNVGCLYDEEDNKTTVSPQRIKNYQITRDLLYSYPGKQQKTDEQVYSCVFGIYFLSSAWVHDQIYPLLEFIQVAKECDFFALADTYTVFENHRLLIHTMLEKIDWKLEDFETTNDKSFDNLLSKSKYTPKY